ncbi:MAG: Fur family transcriptional regulator [Gammaproteobacteria bacterium]|nr:Fur family transcriptional regulator [Gammaproteobacteria bacterium]
MISRARRRTNAQLVRAAEMCAQHGAQLTELRRHVLGLILEAGGPMTAYQLLDRLKRTHKGAAPPTIYRALDFLIEQRLVHRIERLNAFVPCVEAGHLHPAQFLICSQCGVVSEIESRAAASALEHAAEREGFRPRSTVVEIEGVCAACRT